MNYLLSINKKYIFLICFFTFVLFFFYFLANFYFADVNNLPKKKFELSKADITEPRFAINSSKQKILVTAKEGNFVKGGKILLKKNVKFQSENFSIETDNVIFDRKEQTARSDYKSVFKAKNTTISAEGFNIDDEGNKISFNGNSVVILK